MYTHSIYARTGHYESGVCSWFLDVDFEKLASGAAGSALAVELRHETHMDDFHHYHGKASRYEFPDGVKVEAVEELMQSIRDRASELTAGFSVVYNGNNHVGRWDDSEASDAAQEYWNGLWVALGDLPCVAVHDLSEWVQWEGGNIAELLRMGFDYQNPDPAIVESLAENWNDADNAYVNFSEAADQVAHIIRTAAENAAFEAGGEESDSTAMQAVETITRFGYAPHKAVEIILRHQDPRVPLNRGQLGSIAMQLGASGHEAVEAILTVC